MRIRIFEVSKWKVSQASVRLGGLLAMFGVVAYGLVSCSVSRGTVESTTPSLEDTAAAYSNYTCPDGGTPLDGGTIDIPKGELDGGYLCLRPGTVLNLSTTNCTADATFSLPGASDNPTDTNLPIQVAKQSVGRPKILKNPPATKSFQYKFECTTSADNPGTGGTNSGTLEVATGGDTEEHPPRPQ